VYLAISLCDPWGYFPPLIQAALYGLVAAAMMMFIFRGLSGQPLMAVKVSLRAAFLSLLLLLAAGILAGGDRQRRLEIAVKPRAIFSYPVPDIKMTVTPPSYSERESFTENITNPDAVTAGLKPILEGSAISVYINNITYAPYLRAGKQRIIFLPRAEGGFEAQFIVTGETSWQIMDGSRRIGYWPIILLEDDAPTIDRAVFRPLRAGDGLFSLSLDLSDDYGLDEVSVGLRPAGDKRLDFYDGIKLPISGLKAYAGELYVNLSASNFAGMRVDLIVEAVDQAGQTQQKIVPDIMLPEREFSDPLARRLITIRKEIMTKPEERPKLARELKALGLTSGRLTTRGMPMPSVYYMALRSAYWRLDAPKDDENITQARDLLWDLALSLEEGEHAAFKRDILAHLARLKLHLYQKISEDDYTAELQEIDKTIVLFSRASHSSFVQDFDSEKYDVARLRKIYGRILTHIHFKKYDEAIDLVSYLENGFIYNDKGLLSGQGYARFQTAHRARDTMNIIEKTQKQIMSFVLQNSVKLDIAHQDVGAHQDIEGWVSIQRKLGGSVNDVGRDLENSGIDATHLTMAASELMGDVIQSMEAGDMAAAAGYQSQILTLLKSVKTILNREMKN